MEQDLKDLFREIDDLKEQVADVRRRAVSIWVASQIGPADEVTDEEEPQ